MVPSNPPTPLTQPVALRVTDLVASREFFQGLFGLEPAPEFAATGSAVLLTSPIPGHRHFSIKLTTDAVLVRLTGVHVELESVNELLDLYFLALLGGFQTSELRFRRGSLATTIVDPDGHVIEVEAHHAHASFDHAAARPLSRDVRSTPGRSAGEFASRSRSYGASDRHGDRHPCVSERMVR